MQTRHIAIRGPAAAPRPKTAKAEHNARRPICNANMRLGIIYHHHNHNHHMTLHVHICTHATQTNTLSHTGAVPKSGEKMIHLCPSPGYFLPSAHAFRTSPYQTGRIFPCINNSTAIQRWRRSAMGTRLRRSLKSAICTRGAAPKPTCFTLATRPRTASIRRYVSCS